MSRRDIKVEMRRRSAPSDDPVSLHRRFLSVMRNSQTRWWDPAAPIADPKVRGSLEHQVDLGPALSRGGAGYVAYVHRSPDYTADQALYDDRLILGFSLSQEEYGDLLGSALVCLLEAFAPYRVQVISDRGLMLDDYDVTLELAGVSGKDEDGRDGVARLWPATFLDDELCRRTFGLSADEVAARLAGVVERAESRSGGVFLVATTELLGRDELVALDLALRRRLTGP